MINEIPYLTRNSGNMPCVGLGTMSYPEPEKAIELIKYALDIGYRHIDTARKYGSENWVGDAIKMSNVPRDKLWITTKVTEDNAAPVDFMKSLEKSLMALNLNYVDLLLIHWPSRTIPIKDTVGALNNAKKEGLARNIGISNFTTSLIQEAVHCSEEELYCNQIEYHAYINQDKVLHACDKYGILVTCHVPLARGVILNDPIIQTIALKHNKSSAQVALKWLLQQTRISVVPRALSYNEIEENISLFDFNLSDDDMEKISSLRNNNLRVVDPEIRRPLWD